VAQDTEGLSPEVIAAAERGRSLFDEGRYREAIEHLDGAYETYGEAIFFQYIGRCYQELEEYCRAAQNYRRFLRESSPPEAVRSQVQERLIELDERCERDPDDRGEEDDDPRPPIEPEDTGPPRRFGGDSGDRDRPDRGRGLRTAGLVLMGVGGAAFLPGSVLWIVATARHSEYDGNAAFESEWSSFAEIGDYLGWPGLACLGTGVILYLVGRSRSRDAASRLRPSLASTDDPSASPPAL
jgi:tetratricopeptide (TPR) repeat protein